jgi:putative phage-type endonuclease
MFFKKLFGIGSDTEDLPFKVVDLKQGTQQWLNWRHSGIGASDASTIMNENRFKSPDELLHEKQNKVDIKVDIEENVKMQKGKDLEPIARTLYQKNTKIMVQPICIQSILYPWLIASLDGISNDYKKLVEIKCGESAYKQAAQNIIPNYYFGQLQHQLMVTGLNSLDYWCYWPGEMGILIRVDRDNSYIKKLFKQEEKFYQSMMTERTHR